MKTVSAALLLAVLAAGAALIARQWQDPDASTVVAPVVVTQPISEPSTLRLRIEPAAVSDLSQTATRPLFWQSRRPRPPAPQAEVAERTPVPPETANALTQELRLAGVVVVGARSRRALIVWPQQPAGQWLEEGAERDGWRLKKVDGASVSIEAGGRLVELQLHR